MTHYYYSSFFFSTGYYKRTPLLLVFLSCYFSNTRSLRSFQGIQKGEKQIKSASRTKKKMRRLPSWGDQLKNSECPSTTFKKTRISDHTQLMKLIVCLNKRKHRTTWTHTAESKYNSRVGTKEEALMRGKLLFLVRLLYQLIHTKPKGGKKKNRNSWERSLTSSSSLLAALI